jgi:ankyrin repeat protein
VPSIDPLNDALLADLVSATKQGDAEQVRLLLGLGVRPDVVDHISGWSALHMSVLYNPLLLPTLLEHTSNPDLPKVMGGTPLSYVVHELGEKPDAERRQELFEAIALLLQAGANPKSGATDQTAIELARLYHMPDVEAALER